MTVLERELYGRPITVRLERLDEGVHVLLTGGHRTHIGAVSLAEPEGTVETRVFPGHKDQYVSEPWALALAARTGQRACVVCGIHYDNASPAQIREILACTGALLEEALGTLS